MKNLCFLILIGVLSSTAFAGEYRFNKNIDGINYKCAKKGDIEVCGFKNWFLFDIASTSHGKIHILLNTHEATKKNSVWTLYNKPQGHRSSLLTLIEFDCKNQRKRVLQKVAYEDVNLNGSAHPLKAQPSWEHLIPGTIPQQICSFICK